jgi:hypothetical protein
LPFFIFPALSGQLTCARIVAITAADSAVIAAHHKSPATGHRKPIVGSKDPCSAGAVMKEISYGSTDQQQVAWVTLALRASALLSSMKGSKLASAPTQPQLCLTGTQARSCGPSSCHISPSRSAHPKWETPAFVSQGLISPR